MHKITLYEKDIYSGSLILVNEYHPIKRVGVENLIPVTIEYPDILLESRTATMLSYLIKASRCESDIVPVSGYRSYNEQVRIYEDSIIENGIDFTRKYVALPNHSEHQTGMAIDLSKKEEEIDFIRPNLPYTGVFRIFRGDASKYGFIERYQEGKESITNIAHEPWHFRYVGYPHSKVIYEHELSLEEYIDMLKGYSYDSPLIVEDNNQKVHIFYIKLSDDSITFSLPKDSIYQISGNNVDGFVVTLWRK